MPIDYEHLMSLRARGERVQYGDRDTLLYTLAVGLGRDPASRHEAPYLNDPAGLRTVPTLASALVGSRLLDDCGWNAAEVVLRDESLAFDRPLDDAGTLLVDTDVASVLDRDAGGGALVMLESRARRERDGQPLFTVRRTWLARADGGFGGPRGRAEPAGAGPGPVPSRRPDMTCVCETRPDQALLFSLALARGSGPRVPPAGLDGLCLQGIACVAVLREICEYDHTLIRSFEARPVADAFPAERLRIDLWQDANVVTFRVVAADRDQVVLDQGRCVLAT
jgi:hypothetical protein